MNVLGIVSEHTTTQRELASHSAFALQTYALQIIVVDAQLHVAHIQSSVLCLQCRAASLHVDCRLTLVINGLDVSAPHAATRGN